MAESEAQSVLNGAGDRGRTGDVQLRKTTINWKQRTLRFLHLFLATENNPVFTLGFRPVLNGAQGFDNSPFDPEAYSGRVAVAKANPYVLGFQEGDGVNEFWLWGRI